MYSNPKNMHQADTGNLKQPVWDVTGLVFFSLGQTATDTFQRLGVEFFVLLLFELLPFCYMSFYVADRKFYAADVAAKLYHPSAYYLGTVTAGVLAHTLWNSLLLLLLPGIQRGLPYC